MALGDLLPNEASTEFKAGTELRENKSIVSFVDTLTDEQKRRFGEIAHHLVYIGFEEGMLRRQVEPTEAAQARVLVSETELVLKGADIRSRLEE